MNDPDIIIRASELGAEVGRNAASWFFDGNTSDDAYRRVLAGITEGDPKVLDSLPTPNLSGEWADDPTPNSLREYLGVSENDWHSDDDPIDLCEQCCAAWEDSAWEAVQVAVERACVEHFA